MLPISIQKLKYFKAVAEENSYAGAARRMRVSEPTISRNMALLQKDIGFELIGLNNHSVSLTPGGRELLDQVRNLTDIYDEIMEKADILKNRENKMLVVGSPSVIIEGFLMDMIMKFKRNNPEVILNINEDEETECYKKLEDNHYDFSIVMSEKIPEELGSMLLYQNQMFAVFSRADNTDHRPYITFKDLKDYNLFFLNNRFSTYHLIMEHCTKAGYIPKIGETHFDSTYLLNILEYPDDVAILPSSALENSMNSNYLIVPFKPRFNWEIFLVYKKEKPFSQSMNDFQHFIFSEFQRYQNDM